MSKCFRCNLEILDQTTTCPLCNSVLEYRSIYATGYPDIVAKMKKMVFVRRMVGFLSIVSIALCVFIDYHLPGHLDWSILATGGILCGLSVFFVMTNPVAGYIKRILTTLFAAAAMVLVADITTGFNRWSVNYVFPGMIFTFNVGLLILMLINRRRWHSYMIYQILSIVIAAVPVALVYAHIVTFPILSELAFGSCLVVFVGTIIFGGREATMELSRRFHI